MYTPYVEPVGLDVMIRGRSVVWELICDEVLITAAADVVEAAEFASGVVAFVTPNVDVTSSTMKLPLSVVVADLMHIMWDLTVQHVFGAPEILVELLRVPLVGVLVDGFEHNKAGMEDDVALLFLGLVIVCADRDCADEDTTVPSRLE